MKPSQFFILYIGIILPLLSLSQECDRQLTDCQDSKSIYFNIVWLNFEVDIESSYETLDIKIEDIYSGTTFVKQISAKEVESLTKFCQNLPELFEFIKTAFIINEPDIKLEFDDKKGKLTYSYTQKLPIRRVYSFDIILDRIKVSDTERLIQNLEKLSLNSFQNYGYVISPFFSDLGYSNCKLSANFKEITKTANENSWFGYLGYSTLPDFKNKFSVKILKTIQRQILIGVALFGTENSHGYYSQRNSLMLYVQNGNLYCDGRNAGYFTRFLITQGDVISVLVDMKTLMISFELNSVSLGPAGRLNLQESEKKNLRPAIDLYNIGDSVAFL